MIAVTFAAWDAVYEVYVLRALALVLLTTATARAEPPAPFGAPGHPVTQDVRAASPRATAEPGGSSPFGLGWRVYRGVVGKYQGPRCQHRPSCSAYAMQAVDQYGLVVGPWLAVNRLWRHDTSSGARKLRRDEDGAYLDPLADAMFWLDGSGPR